MLLFVSGEKGLPQEPASRPTLFTHTLSVRQGELAPALSLSSGRQGEGTEVTFGAGRRQDPQPPPCESVPDAPLVFSAFCVFPPLSPCASRTDLPPSVSLSRQSSLRPGCGFSSSHQHGAADQTQKAPSALLQRVLILIHSFVELTQQKWTMCPPGPQVHLCQ